MSKHKPHTLPVGQQPAVSQADVCRQIHSIISQSERRLEMGFSAQMGLKGDIYAREILHATAKKNCFGEKKTLNFLCVMNI